MQKTFIKDELHTIAENILDKARSENSQTATVITLSGDLGVGKTALTQEIAKILGVQEKVVSPTFIIFKKYGVVDKTFKNLIHIDAYRLNKSEELLRLGWQELFENKDNLIIIEWPERVPECVKDSTCKVSLKHHNEDTRTLEILL